MANPPGWQPKKPVEVPVSKLPGKNRISLTDVDFDELIRTQGVRVQVYRSMLCPNLKSIDGGEHNIDCKICNNGFIDLEPMESMAFIQNQGLDTKYLPEGHYDANTVVATFPIGTEVTYFTLVKLCDYTDIFYEVIKRQEFEIDKLKYKALKVNVIVDYQGKQYYANQDYKLDVNGNIAWFHGKGPKKGTLYSIHYELQLGFRIQSAQHANRFAQILKGGNVKMTKMPEQWIMAREYLVHAEDQQGKPIKSNKIRDSDQD